MSTSHGWLALVDAVVGEPLSWVVGPHRKWRGAGRFWLCEGDASPSALGPGELTGETVINVLACLGLTHQPRRSRSGR